MTIPNSCEIGLVYWQDLTEGPSVNSAWTVETISTSAGVVWSNNRYERLNVVDASSHDDRSISQTLSGTPKTIEVEMGIDINEYHYSNGLASSNYNRMIFLAYEGIINTKYAGLEFFSNRLDGTRKTVRVRLVTQDGGINEFSEQLFEKTFEAVDTPYSSAVSGTLKLTQVSASAIQVYWNGVLKTTIFGDNLTTSQGFEIGRIAFPSYEYELHEGWVKNIGYVGVSGLGTDCYSTVVNFVSNKTSGPNPLYVRFTDVSILSAVTSATDYTRVWSFVNSRTSAIDYEITTSASINYVFEGNYQDTFDVSLSAVY